MKGPFRAELTVRKGESDSASFPGLYLTGTSSPARDMIAFVVRASDCGVHLYPASSPNVGVWGGVTVGKAKGNSTQTETGVQTIGKCTMEDETIYVGFGGNGTKSVGHDLRIRERTPGMMVIVQ